MNGGILRGILLIIAMLALGGIIAFVGDRVGSKAGKARLRLGKLRPRQTASLVTIATGTLTAAIVTGILLATSESLRQGIFRIREIRQELAQTREARDRAMMDLEDIRSDLEAAETSKIRIQQELDEAEAAKAEAQQVLDRLGSQLRAERAQARQLRSAIGELQSEIGTLTQERQDLVAEQEQLQNERERLQEEIKARDLELASREEEIDLQERELQASAARLRKLEAQRQNLAAQRQDLQNEIRARESEIAALDVARQELERDVRELEVRLARRENDFVRLRLEEAALESGEVIVSAGVRVGPDLSSQEAVDRVLSEANKRAFEKLFPGIATERPIIFILEEEVERLRADIADGERYIIRVRSAQKYLEYERRVDVVIERIPDEEVFQLGDVIATVRIDREIDRDRFRANLGEHIEKLTISALSRAKSEGLIGLDILYDDDDNFVTFLNFVERLKQLKGPVDSIEAVARENIFLSGPLKVDLVARREGQVVLSSNSPPTIEDGTVDESALNQ